MDNVFVARAWFFRLSRGSLWLWLLLRFLCPRLSVFLAFPVLATAAPGAFAFVRLIVAILANVGRGGRLTLTVSRVLGFLLT